MPRTFYIAFIGLGLALALAPAAPHAHSQSTPIPPPTNDTPPTGYAKIIPLWSGPAPLAKGTLDADIPKLYFYPATGPTAHSAVIVLPGGGYTHVVNEKEGAVEARWLSAHGIPSFVLTYRLSPRYRFPAPMLDGARAIRYVRSHAADYSIDPDKIGIWGFSAGGHLAGYLATQPDTHDPTSHDPIERVSAHPDFAIFSYGRLSMDDSIPRPGNLEALIGDNPTRAMLDAVSPDKHVTKTTSPSFIYSTTGDQTVNSMTATAYYDALKRTGVPVELHIFELGPHGTGMGQNLKGMPELQIWPTLLQHWLQLHNWMAEAQ